MLTLNFLWVAFHRDTKNRAQLCCGWPRDDAGPVIGANRPIVARLLQLTSAVAADVGAADAFVVAVAEAATVAAIAATAASSAATSPFFRCILKTPSLGCASS